MDFARPSQLCDEIPKVEQENLTAEIGLLEKQIEVCQNHIKECADKRAQLRVISDYFRTRAQKYEVLGTIPQSERTFLISGYVPKKAGKRSKKSDGREL